MILLRGTAMRETLLGEITTWRDGAGRDVRLARDTAIVGLMSCGSASHALPVSSAELDLACVLHDCLSPDRSSATLEDRPDDLPRQSILRRRCARRHHRLRSTAGRGPDRSGDDHYFVRPGRPADQ